MAFSTDASGQNCRRVIPAYRPHVTTSSGDTQPQWSRMYHQKNVVSNLGKTPEQPQCGCQRETQTFPSLLKEISAANFSLARTLPGTPQPSRAGSHLVNRRNCSLPRAIFFFFHSQHAYGHSFWRTLCMNDSSILSAVYAPR